MHHMEQSRAAVELIRCRNAPYGASRAAGGPIRCRNAPYGASRAAGWIPVKKVDTNLADL
ncbi:hypothetical protein PCCS19_51080 [Paenibacillus sp. CCS19]|nr:hypothetical protein PCCS19_51080 [Paenibacillus cellulosilyticus]